MIRLLHIDMNSLREKSQILTFEGQVTNHIKDRPSLTSMHCRVHLKTNCKPAHKERRKNWLHCTTKILQDKSLYETYRLSLQFNYDVIDYSSV